MSKTSPLPPDHIVSTELDGGEGVLVDLNSRRYYQLNETAMLVWRCLERGCSVQETAEELTREYEVTQEGAAASVMRILAEFQSRELIGPDRKGG